jgi:hypothetical protein
VCTSPVPHTCYKPHPSHSFWFDHSNNIWSEVHIMKPVIMQSSPVPCYPVPLRPKYLPQHLVLKHRHRMFVTPAM